MTAGTSRIPRQTKRGPRSPYILCLRPLSYFWCVVMILFTSLLNPISKNGLALAFHVKSMRAAQFIKLDSRALNREFLDPTRPSRIGETKKKKGSWRKASPIPWQHWWMTFLSPLPPRVRVQYVQDLLIFPTISFAIICFCKECLKGDYNGFVLSGCWPAVTQCVSHASVWQQQAGL